LLALMPSTDIDHSTEDARLAAPPNYGWLLSVRPMDALLLLNVHLWSWNSRPASCRMFTAVRNRVVRSSVQKVATVCHSHSIIIVISFWEKMQPEVESTSIFSEKYLVFVLLCIVSVVACVLRHGGGNEFALVRRGC
jgi:hypothetical protein